MCRLVNKNRAALEPKPAYLQPRVNQLAVLICISVKKDPSVIVTRTTPLWLCVAHTFPLPVNVHRASVLLRARCHRGMLGMQLGDE